MTSTQMTELEEAGLFVEGLIQATVGQSSMRDRQKMPGPSDLADPCDLCVARKIAQACEIPMQGKPRNFSLKAWVGTSVHEKIERDFSRIYTRAKQEVEVDIKLVPGLGMIKGHVDLYVPDKKHLTDIKTADMDGPYGIKKYQREGPPERYIGQVNMYAYGLNSAGMPVEGFSLVFIPRDSNSRSDIWRCTFPYEETVATVLLERAGFLTSVLQSGQTGKLTSHPECFVCNYTFRS